MRDQGDDAGKLAALRHARSVVKAAQSFRKNSIASVGHLVQLAEIEAMPGGGRRAGQGMGMEDLWK